MSAGPSSSGVVLGLSYTPPIMLLHQILEPEEEKGMRAISHRILGDQPVSPCLRSHGGQEPGGSRREGSRNSSLLRYTVTLPCPTFWLDSMHSALSV